MPCKTRFHLGYFLGFDTEGLGYRPYLRRRQRVEGRFHASQVEKQLSLRLGCGDLHQAPVPQDEFVNLGADPVNGKRYESDTAFRVETLHRLHQPYVPLLNQVSLRQAVTHVATRDGYHHPEVGKHKLPRGLDIAVGSEQACQPLLLLGRQQGEAIYRLNVTLQTAYGYR